MELIFSYTSPYARKVRAVIIEKGLQDRVHMVPDNPWGPAKHVRDHNPLGKVPVLVRNDGPTLTGSTIICEYLDWTDNDPILHAKARMQHWAIARHVALCDGVLDAAVNVVLENKRPEDKRWDDWTARYHGAIERTLDALNGEPVPPMAAPTMASLALGVALGYLDFRLPTLDWRDRCHNLAEWYEDFAQRPSMTETVPKE